MITVLRHLKKFMLVIFFLQWKNIAEEHEHYKFQRKRIKICKTMGLEKNRNRSQFCSNGDY